MSLFILLELSMCWQFTVAIFTILGATVTAIYTAITYGIFKQNKNVNQFSVYLALRNNLTSDVFTYTAHYAKKAKLIVDRSNSINSPGYKTEHDSFEINLVNFKRDVLDNIEDLAIFWDRGILSSDLIDAGYGYSILYIGANQTVREIIKELLIERETCNGFGRLYIKIHSALNDKEKGNYPPTLIDKLKV